MSEAAAIVDPGVASTESPFPFRGAPLQPGEVPEASVFSMKTQAISGGRDSNTIAQTDLFRISVKIYAEGGENGLHAHTVEDHAFIILKGQATFELGKDRVPHVVGPYEGVCVPRGAFYRFQNSSDEELVMLRIGSETGQKIVRRVHPDGSNFVANTPERKKANGSKPPVYVPGTFHFG